MCRLLQLCINVSFVVSLIVIRALQHTAAGFKNIFIYVKCLMCMALIDWGVRSYKATDKTEEFAHLLQQCFLCLPGVFSV